MNLIYAEIVDVACENGSRQGTVRIGGAMRKVALDLLPESERGDRVLLCDGIAIGKVEEAPNPAINHVPRNSR